MPSPDVKIEKVGDGAMLYAIKYVSGRPAGNQAERSRFQRPVRSHCPDDQPDGYDRLYGGQQQRALKKDIAEHSETDAGVETQCQVEEAHKLNRPRRGHDDVNDQPLCRDVEQKRDDKSDRNPDGSMFNGISRQYDFPSLAGPDRQLISSARAPTPRADVALAVAAVGRASRLVPN